MGHPYTRALLVKRKYKTFVRCYSFIEGNMRCSAFAFFQESCL